MSVCSAYAYPVQGAGSVRPHAVLSAGTASFVYDANGNQVDKLVGGTSRRAITYDADNRPAGVAAGGATVTYL